MSAATDQSANVPATGQQSRRRFLQITAGGALSQLALGHERLAFGASTPPEPFQTRGYYLGLQRLPDFGLEEWKAILRYMKEDRCNYLILWMGGAFRSRRFPITWQYNRDHLNIQHDFVRPLIDYAHSLGIKVVLGFTPFAYDGVNQYPLEHPELKALQRDGSFNKLWGIHSWGYILCPSQLESQRFILEYVSELFFDFYPNADGIMIESSDYGVCYCPSCKGRYYEREFEFVKAISDRIWRKSAQAEVIVYPQYFVPGEQSKLQTTLPKYDPRWTLFFTFHSTPLVKDLVKKAPRSLQYDSFPYRSVEEIKTVVQKIRDFGVNGITPSLECFSFLAQYPEGDFWQMIGRRYKPFSYGWLRPGEHPYNALLTRVWRIAFREFSRNPDLPWSDFRTVLQRDLFHESTPPSAVDDLLEWQKAFVTDTTWWTPSPILSPEILRWRLELGRVKPSQLEDYRVRLARLRQIRARYRKPSQDPSLEEMLRGLDHVLGQWNGKEWMLTATQVLPAKLT